MIGGGTSNTRSRIRDLLGTATRPMTSAELADKADRGQCHVNAVLKIMQAAGEAVRVDGVGRRGQASKWVSPIWLAA